MSAKKTQEQFEKEMEQLHPNLTVIGEYTTARNPIEVRCNIHNYHYSVVAGTLLGNKYGCKLCAREHWGLKQKKYQNNDDFINDMNKANPNVIVLEDYKDARTRIEVRCKVCGNEWKSDPYSLLKGSGCKKCAMKYVQNLKIKSHEEFLDDFKKRNENYDKIKVLTKYQKYELPITCECLECHNVWETTPHYLCGDGSGCPLCKLSKGEGRIRRFFVDNNISYISQKTFDGLLGCGGKPLRFDFYLPNYNLLLEYQGQFHDNTVSYQTKERYERLKEHDKRKKIFAKENGYELFEIWYQDYDNIETILQEKLLGDKSDGKQC